MNQPLVFSQLYLPRPLSGDAIVRVFGRLAADSGTPPLVLECRADVTGTRHLLGVPGDHVVWVHRTLSDLLPGLMLLALVPEHPRRPVTSAADVTFRPAALGLSEHSAETTTAALLSALNAKLFDGEELVVQLILGPTSAGHAVRGHVSDPHSSLWRAVTQGRQVAPAGIAKQIEQRLGRNGFRAALRVGITATTDERRRRLGSGLAGALASAKPADVSIVAKRLRSDVVNTPVVPKRWPLRLTAVELPCLMGWPLGDGDLPGVAPVHPKLLLPKRMPKERERILGYTALPGTTFPIGISPSDSLMHMILIGPTGSGKSTSLLVQCRADIAAGRTLLVIDPKKQLIDDIVARCVPAEQMDRVIIIDPADPQVPAFNPLDVGNRDPDVVVDGLLAVFKAVFSDGWGPRTEDVFLAVLLTLARAGQRRKEPFTLLDIPTLLTDEKFRRSVIGTIAGDPVLEGFWAAYNELSPGAQASMIAAPMNKLRRYLMRPAVVRLLGQPRPKFRLRDIFRDHLVVLVALNDGLIGPITSQLIGSLIVSETWMATMERANEAAPMDDPAVVVVDECQNFVHLPTSFGDALSQSRSYGVAWVLAHQSRKQMPADLLESVDSNARSKVIYRLESAKDAAAIASLAPELDVADIQKLPRHHAYVRVVTDGEASGWTAVKTLPPPDKTSLAADIRTRSRERYGSIISSPTPSSRSTTQQAPAEVPLGRKRRSRAAGGEAK